MENPDQKPHFFQFYLVLVLVNRDVVASSILRCLDVVVDIRTVSNDRSSGQESVFLFVGLFLKQSGGICVYPWPVHAHYPL